MKKMNGFKMIAAAVVLVVSLTACSSSGGGGSYPNKPFIVTAPSGAGGGWDKTARSLSKVLTETKLVDQTITVENKPGGGGTVFLAEYVAKDSKDPYKLFVSSPPILINNLKAEGNSPYGYKDVTPLAQMTKDFGAIAVSADSKFTDLKSLLDALKADPTSITLAGGSAPGSMDHLISVLPAFKHGIDPKVVKYLSYDGGGEAIAALLGNNADAIGTDVSSLGSYLKAGKIKILAVTSPERLGGDFADVPTLKELGLDAEFLIWRGVFGPKEMSKDELAYWDKALKSLSENDAWAAELKANDWASEYKNSADFTAYLAEQEKTVQELLTALGMQK
ncbi:tripartite tricarboxylate transporter substrate binding protein [Paenibacillus sp. GSMTC-2017]|uniref:Bug family tripartite tricarboxylate transporter substrate binding protein n=1 Tax=Paenibacillus sp. GSMTC-2017 TaxID=2794350 RepID=UPI0018D9914A|nr:tripartite tricarboxylate transporter substrate-binding protein [Paenibacillus sp. GSMTC-2017]MBH5319676.1 tripartite tricarboxylate transporter substrate binding protein [Paenibacillus sp. GSMTC-2017]